MLAVTFYDVVLWAHIMAVVIGFGGVFSYPVWFAFVARAEPEKRAWFHEVQGAIGKYLISTGIIVIFAAGAYMATDRDLWGEIWVIVPLIILAAIFVLGPTFFGPKEARLRELAEQGAGPEYDRLFAQVRNVGYASMAGILVATYFMVTKVGA
jgi:MFS family permease